MAGEMQKAGKGLGEDIVIFKRMANNRCHQAAVQICRKTNEIKHLILSQTLMQQGILDRMIQKFALPEPDISGYIQMHKANCHLNATDGETK